MTAPTKEKLLEQFRKCGVEAPAEYIWLFDHKTLGFDDFSQFEPWQFCGMEEVRPLSERWPKAGIKKLLIPFARLQCGDDLACFEFDAGKVARVWHIHYQLGNPIYVEFHKEYADIWEWLHSTIKDFRDWFEMSAEKK